MSVYFEMNRVEVAYEEETRKAQQVAVEQQSQKQMTAEKIAELNQNVLNHIKATEKRMQESRSKQATAESHLVEAVAAAAKSVALTTNSTTGGGDYYSHYYEQNADLYGKSDKETSAYNYWLNNDYFNNQLVGLFFTWFGPLKFLSIFLIIFCMSKNY